jgi:atrazine chlorohydrolase/5-methylthioadenosine/S-adenosylhomocysteine deaminase/melamine deaminase
MTMRAVVGGRVVTMDPDRRLLEPGTVLIEDDRIAAVGPVDAVEVPADADVIDARGMAVLPGLVNAHTHVSQILLRGGPSPDRGLLDWLFNVLYPGLDAYEADDVRVAATLYSVEALRHGVTTIVDNEDGGWGRYDEFGAATIGAFADCGIRAVYARMYCDGGVPMDRVLDVVMAKEPDVVHPDVVEPLDRVVRDLDALMRRFHGTAGGRISVWPSPGSPLSVTPDGLHAAQRLAAEHGTSWALHLAEIEAEEHVLGMTPTQYIDSHGCIDPRLLAGHCVHVDPHDIRLLARGGARVSTQPVSNGYLGSGVAPVPALLAAGLAVGVGTDDACCNDAVNLLADIKVLACLQKAVHRDAAVVSAERLLEMVTIDGARAVGMASDIGSLEVGKKADVIAIDLRRPQTTPAHDVAATLVYQAEGSEVDTVLVDGKVLVRGGRLSFLGAEDEQRLYADASERSEKILLRAGMAKTSRWSRWAR